MSLFLISLAALVIGYFTYGYIVEKVLKVNDEEKTPAYTMSDGVDYIPMPSWKVFLIQFLNIAGIGPIFGAIMGIQYGPSAFLWIVLGTIFAGGVHDYVSGMVSLRSGGKSLPEIVGQELGRPMEKILSVISVFLLVMVVAVFVLTPAGLLNGMTQGVAIHIGSLHIPFNLSVWICIIFLYYILATLLPIDKVIGNLYPVFGAALLFMALGLIGYMIFSGVEIPTGIGEGLYNRKPDPGLEPIFPMMFVSIACGAISGFHATQSPMMARCLKTERHGRFVFYGAMVAEGVVALVWAAAAITYFGGYADLDAFFKAAKGNDAGTVVDLVCNHWLGVVGGVLAILGVIAAPITTGDTAMRSARLIIADALHLDQKKFVKRFLVALPIIAVSYFLMQIDFSVLWRYFGWSNQTLSIFTLWACTVYLARKGRAFIITLIPAMFMTVVCFSYILYAPLGTPSDGIGLPYDWAIIAGCIVAAAFLALFALWLVNYKKSQPLTVKTAKK